MTEAQARAALRKSRETAIRTGRAQSLVGYAVTIVTEPQSDRDGAFVSVNYRVNGRPDSQAAALAALVTATTA